MKIDNNKGTLGAAVAGINTIALAAIQNMTMDEGLQKFLTLASPILITALVYLIDWVLAYLNLESAPKMRAAEQMDKKIKHLKDQIREFESLGFDKSPLEKELLDAIIAKGKIYTAIEVDKTAALTAKG
jgi:hypothetical protein